MRIKSVKVATNMDVYSSKLMETVMMQWPWSSCAFIVNIDGLVSFFNGLFSRNTTHCWIYHLINGRKWDFQENHSISFHSEMTSFPITEEAVKQLLEKKLYDSAEYWSSLLLQEKNLEPVDSCNRYLLYADCLYHNQKYEHAAVIVSSSILIIVLLSTYPLYY